MIIGVHCADPRLEANKIAADAVERHSAQVYSTGTAELDLTHVLSANNELVDVLKLLT